MVPSVSIYNQIQKICLKRKNEIYRKGGKIRQICHSASRCSRDRRCNFGLWPELKLSSQELKPGSDNIYILIKISAFGVKWIMTWKFWKERKIVGPGWSVRQGGVSVDSKLTMAHRTDHWPRPPPDSMNTSVSQDQFLQEPLLSTEKGPKIKSYVTFLHSWWSHFSPYRLKYHYNKILFIYVSIYLSSSQDQLYIYVVLALLHDRLYVTFALA